MPASWSLRAGRPAFALSATELLEPGADLLGAAYVGISQSGKSAETVKGFSRVSAPRLALTNTGRGLSELADVSLPIGSAKMLPLPYSPTPPRLPPPRFVALSELLWTSTGSIPDLGPGC